MGGEDWDIAEPVSRQRCAAVAPEPVGKGGDSIKIAILLHFSDWPRNLMSETRVYKTYMCLICGFIYDEAAGLPEEGIPAGTKWEDVPVNWVCPECGARKDDFELVEV
jgi:rubredoxin